METFESKKDRNPANRDPLTGEPGSHPAGTATGSVGGALAGGAVGAAVGGPVGAAVGGAIGAVVGGATGHNVGEAVNPTVETAYWRENYSKRPYYRKDRKFDDYEPAYRYGWESAGDSAYRSRKFEEIEPDLQRKWKQNPSGSGMDWSEAREASRDAWYRVRGV